MVQKQYRELRRKNVQTAGRERKWYVKWHLPRHQAGSWLSGENVQHPQHHFF